MRKGEATSGLDFFVCLEKDDEFCAALGRATLAASKLETMFVIYLRNSGQNDFPANANLGRMLAYAQANQLLARIIPHLNELKDQRNYITHNLHHLFYDLVAETALPMEGLIDSDVDIYTDRMIQLAENLNGLARIVKNET